MRTELYLHHDKQVHVRSDLKGRHRDFCLCTTCTNFLPGKEGNCPKAQALYEFDVAHGMTTPVWECPVYRRSPASYCSTIEEEGTEIETFSTRECAEDSFRVFIDRNVRRNKLEFFIYAETTGRIKERKDLIAMPATFRLYKEGEFGHTIEPVLSIPIKDGVALVESLLSQNIKPKNIELTEGAKESMKGHLKDMRKLVEHFGELELPK